MVKLFFDLRLLKDLLLADAELPVTLIPRTYCSCAIWLNGVYVNAFVTSALLKVTGPVLVKTIYFSTCRVRACRLLIVKGVPVRSS
jgi:hypothetical protein